MKVSIEQSIKRIIFIYLAFIFTVTSMIAQTEETKIDELINEGNFNLAAQKCEELLKRQLDNPALNFKTGYCFMNIPLKKNMAIPYLEKADELYSRLDNAPPEALETRFYLGKAYHKNYNFDKAIDIFEKMKIGLKNKELLTAIDEEIKQCNTGKELLKNQVKIQVNNLGSKINSIYADHSPVISADESLLIFTSRRKTSENENIDSDGQYNEDIFLSTTDGKEWLEPKGISNNINTETHEASIGLSADGQQLLIYNESESGSILISTLIGDEWSVPVNAGNNINTRYRETHASISADGRIMYFTSDRPGGFGGMDIYLSNLQSDGSWGPAINLGQTINTDKDEDGPYIHPDGLTLYFSSKGHETMGGYDIFISKKNEFGTWTKPENYGYPVNTTEDDIFFVITVDGKRAYFASYREGGFGNMDIYMMGLTEAEEVPLTIVKGNVTACKTDIGNVQIKVYESGKEEVIGLYKPNSKTGKYLFILSRGKNYEARYEIDGNESRREIFEIGTDADFQIIYRQVDLKTGKPCNEYVGTPLNEDNLVGIDSIEIYENDKQYTVIENIIFKINSSETGFYKENLIKLAEYLINNKKCRIQIIGYTDTQGPVKFNQKLSIKRAQSIYNFLINNGVKKDQLSYRGNGFDKQISVNKYNDGTFAWNSLPYNRRVEFEIISDQNQHLKIRPINIPEIYDLKKQQTLDSGSFRKYENKYTIQVGAYQKPLAIGYFKKLKNMQMYYIGKLYHYTSGEFDTKESAGIELKTIINNGYPDAFIRPLSFYLPTKK